MKLNTPREEEIYAYARKKTIEEIKNIIRKLTKIHSLNGKANGINIKYPTEVIYIGDLKQEIKLIEVKNA